MKRLLGTLVLAAGLGSIAAAAPAGYFGVYTLGVQYTLPGYVNGNDLRLSLGLPVVEGVVGGEGVLGLNVAADVLVPGGALSSDGLFTWDYGGGLNLAFLTAPGGSVIDVNPRALVGVNYAFTPKVSGFAELELGPAFNVGTGPITFGIVPDARIGVNFY